MSFEMIASHGARWFIVMRDPVIAFAAERDQGLYSGLIRIHILYHACQEPIFGLGMIEELHRHGYRMSAGTLYPLLHGLEKKGLLRSKEMRSGKIARRVYRATPAGRRALLKARTKVEELLGELLEDKSLSKR